MSKKILGGHGFVPLRILQADLTSSCLHSSQELQHSLEDELQKRAVTGTQQSWQMRQPYGSHVEEIMIMCDIHLYIYSICNVYIYVYIV